MKVALLVAAMFAGAPVAAGERDVPIGNRCAGIHFYTLVETQDYGDGWLRAVIAKSMAPGAVGTFRTHVWDVHCRDGLLADAGGSLEEAESVPAGMGPWPKMRCAPDQKFPGVAEMICGYHAKARATK